MLNYAAVPPPAAVPATPEPPLVSPVLLLVVFMFVGVGLWCICRVPYASDGVPRSRLTYILLGLFTGVLGIHNFYAGYKFKGAIAVLLTMTVVGGIASAIMALIDIATVTHDAAGVRFKE